MRQKRSYGMFLFIEGPLAFANMRGRFGVPIVEDMFALAYMHGRPGSRSLGVDVEARLHFF